MSRLDYITIGIVAACILAIIFLVYKMTDLFKEDTATDPIESTTTQVETEGDDVYDYDIEDDSTSVEGENASDGAPTTGGTNGETANNSSDESPTRVADTEDDEDPTPDSSPTGFNNPSTSTGGKYMVIAGTFDQRANAKKQVDKLKKLGYSSASMEIFDRGKYAVVLVDRFNNMASAERLVKDLKAEDVQSYVKVKRAN
ncbi:MAG: SPOR domain-containing protein [Bacteroidota bacterium]